MKIYKYEMGTGISGAYLMLRAIELNIGVEEMKKVIVRYEHDGNGYVIGINWDVSTDSFTPLCENDYLIIKDGKMAVAKTQSIMDKLTHKITDKQIKEYIRENL